MRRPSPMNGMCGMRRRIVVVIVTIKLSRFIAHPLHFRNWDFALGDYISCGSCVLCTPFLPENNLLSHLSYADSHARARACKVNEKFGSHDFQLWIRPWFMAICRDENLCWAIRRIPIYWNDVPSARRCILLHRSAAMRKRRHFIDESNQNIAKMFHQSLLLSAEILILSPRTPQRASEHTLSSYTL